MQTGTIKNAYDSFLLRLDESGSKIALTNLTEYDDNVLLKFTAFEMVPDEKVILGSYSVIPNEESLGMYFGKIKNGEIQFIKYHEYIKSLSNYFSSYSIDAQEFMAKKIGKIEKNGNNYMRDDYFIAHPLIKHQTGYYFIGEFYWTNIWEDGSSYFNTSHAMVISFDENGNILWNNSIGVNITNFDYYKPKIKDVAVEFENEKIKLRVANNDSITVASLNAAGNIENMDTYKNIRNKIEGFYQYQYWYDNRFLSVKYLWGDRSYDSFLVVTTYPE